MLSESSTRPGLAGTNPAPIGVFDSGVGGLSVLRHVHEMLPQETLLYVADAAHAPYGGRSAAEIQTRARAVCGWLVAQGAKAVVVACNTATVVAVAALRAEFQIPIVAMEPAIKPAAGMTRTGAVGVLATERTLASEQFQSLVQRYGHGVRILSQACPGLVELVERGQLDQLHSGPLLAGYLQPLLDQEIDVLVLGCTHYPFLLPVIRSVAGPGVTVIDPAVAVTQQLQRRLTTDAGLAPPAQSGSVRFYTSSTPERVKPVVELLWRAPVQLEQILSPVNA